MISGTWRTIFYRFGCFSEEYSFVPVLFQKRGRQFPLLTSWQAIPIWMFAPNAMTPTEALKRCIDRLPAEDQQFAASLLSAPHPSTKQLYWIEQLAEPATPTEPTKPLAGFIAIYQMMHRASEKLQHPKVLAKAGDTTIRLTVAGERSKTPGAINVTAAESSGHAIAITSRLTLRETI
jgi:hypothetical protein